MKTSIAKKKGDLQALLVEYGDTDNWSLFLCAIRGYRFDQIFILPFLTEEQHIDLLCHKTENGQIYGCWNLYEQRSINLFNEFRKEIEEEKERDNN